MATITELEQDNKHLNSIKSDVSDIVQYLNNTSSELTELSKNIDTRYSVDDNSTPTIDRIISLKEKIENTSSYLNNTILPALGTSIIANNNSISKLQDQEKETASKSSTSTTSTSTSVATKTVTSGYSVRKTSTKEDDKKKNDKWNRW